MIEQYQITTQLSVQKAITSVCDWFKSRHVRYIVDYSDGTVRTEWILLPFILGALDPRVHSKTSHLGINPVIFVDKVTVRMVSINEKNTVCHVRIIYWRLYFPPIFMILMIYAIYMSGSGIGIINVCIIMSLSIIFIVFGIIGRRILKRELNSALTISGRNIVDKKQQAQD